MSVYFNVAPRYTPGSPAQVNGDLARRVAWEEKQAIEYYLNGTLGEANRALAETAGLAGIAEMRYERADCWIVEDLCTGRTFIRPFAVHGETPLREGRRRLRLKAKYGYPLESDPA